MLRLERKKQPLAHRTVFLQRMAASIGLGSAIVAASLLVGMIGYHSFEQLSWMDAFLNASMLLSGMGPLAQPQTDGGKVFAGFYALFSGFAVLAITGVILTPVFHRMMHAFHLAEENGS